MKLTLGAQQFLEKALGADGFEELHKTELYKLQTNTVLDPSELKTALQIVPRAILALLHRELSVMKVGDGKEFKLPVAGDAFLHATKMSNDVYTGHIREKSNIIAKFLNRSIPGIGLTVMTTFELYAPDDMADRPKPESSDDSVRIQKLIDERLGLIDTIKQAVDRRLEEREMINHLVRMRLIHSVMRAEEKKEEKPVEEAPKKIPRPLRSFLDKKSQKKTPEFHIEMSKSETLNCQDCGNEIFSNGVYSGCVCYGADMNNKIFIKKTESGFSMRFPKSWDADNIQMLIKALRQRSEK